MDRKDAMRSTGFLGAVLNRATRREIHDRQSKTSIDPTDKRSNR
jgi:hypothetical protein